MKRAIDLSTLDWKLSGWPPHWWRISGSMETGITSRPEVPWIPAKVPGSVQGALREAGILPDWNVGLNSRQCDWVENRHWIFEAMLPDLVVDGGQTVSLNCLGLDYCGAVFLNGKQIGGFCGSFLPYIYDLTPHLLATGNRISIAFECAPRWLGQFGFTSQIKEWKPRFNYTWDWTARLVQIGIWDTLSLVISEGAEFGDINLTTDFDVLESTGTLTLRGLISGNGADRVKFIVGKFGESIAEADISCAEFAAGWTWSDLPVQSWNPNGSGVQPLYDLSIRLLDLEGKILDTIDRRIGFKHLTWRPNKNAPADADPWICVVNGRETFLQGVNWTPILPNFADVTVDQYRRLLELYRDLGCNLLRVWGGAFLEKPCFYDICDELGLLVWQEFPLSSSGIDNWPPEDEQSIHEEEEIAYSYIVRRRHHVSLALWCGGNELQGALDGGKIGVGKPIDHTHPMMARLLDLVRQEDPARRFLASSSSGPRFMADEKDYGKGLHWDTHGPWSISGSLEVDWSRYWENDDSLFRSETGVAGASPVDIIESYAGGLETTPGTADNPLWQRTSWWIEWHVFAEEKGREPESLEEYVAWSQRRQAAGLAIAVQAAKSRFPACGGILIWMGHDSFPCTANTSIIDFLGRPKPAALAIGEIFRQ